MLATTANPQVCVSDIFADAKMPNRPLYVAGKRG